MVHRRFSWPFGGQRASFCGSFTGWRECPMGLVGTEFQVVFDLPPGLYQIAILDARLPVKQAFNIMHDEGLALVPLWDDGQGTVTGMLTASDFVLILRKRNIRVLGHEELEMHPVSAWKEAKLQYYGGADVAGMQRRPLVHVKDSDNLRDVALTIIQNEISSVPIFKSSMDISGIPLLNLATLPGILKFLCSKLQEQPEGYPILRNQISSIPIGTWSQHTGRASTRQLRTSGLSAPLITCLDFLLEDRISSIPIVDDNGSLLDVYSLSDIMALAKNDVYACIELEQLTVENALELQYQVNGRRQCHTCLSTSTLLEVLDQLSVPGVRRLVVIEPMTRFVQGIISLRDAITFLLG
ncbi:hypothetical protein ACQJBY_009976 [Aegilops geniculata]